MAYSRCDSEALRNAILRVWTPTVGARSWETLIKKNIDNIFASADPFLATHMIRDQIPLNLSFPIDCYSEDRPPFQFKEKILSGSWSEGLYLNGYSNTSVPDIDFMLVLEHISFSEESQRCGKLMLKEDTPFVDAYITDENVVKLWKKFLHDEDEAQSNRLSSKKLKERLRENHQRRDLISYASKNSNINNVDGAAMYIFRGDHSLARLNSLLNTVQSTVSDDMGNMDALEDFVMDVYKELFTGCDIVIAISCDGWPSCAREWITRDRIWPQCDLVQKIIRDGFYIVPKSSVDGDFRLSFSCTETTLTESLTKLQHKILRSFKAVVKYHEKSWSPNIKEIITTYHLKTIAFWYFEKRMQGSFAEETVGTHLILLLKELAEALRSRELPMYFMPKVSLFKNIENPEEAVDIADKIEELSSNFDPIIRGLENITSGFAQLFNYSSKILRIKCKHYEAVRGKPLPDEKVQKLQKVCASLFEARNYLQSLYPQDLNRT